MSVPPIVAVLEGAAEGLGVSDGLGVSEGLSVLE